MPSLAAVSASPGVRCVIHRGSLCGGRAPGRTAGRLSAGTRTHARGLSASGRDVQPSLRRDVPACEGGRRFFDTHAVVRLFEGHGFTTRQAETLVRTLLQMTKSNMDAIDRDMVTKVQQEMALQRLVSHIAAVKKDMIILEKSEFCSLLTESEKLKIQLLQLKVQLVDVMGKVRSDAILDMHLEKSRVKELKAEHEKKLLETRTGIMEMARCSPA
ncbi:mitochondrial calcium uniporter regulator 1 isoform X2 [Brachionichthys hirsutus]|uniref:mitochondrial calcium uniporter regulator 1 isoform X2 n=1 Tax=Brachionichthys hirsutus TaxID=412623 RepID=UPI0036045A02